MPPEDVWQPIQDELSQLLRDSALAPFHQVLEKMQQWTSAKACSPEIFRVVIELVQKMSIDVQRGHSISDMMDQVIAGKYVQPGWDVHSVRNVSSILGQL